MKQSPMNLPSTEAALGSENKAPTTLSKKQEPVEKNKEADLKLCQEGLLFQKRVLKVCAHFKQENIVPARVSCCLKRI